MLNGVRIDEEPVPSRPILLSGYNQFYDNHGSGGSISSSKAHGDNGMKEARKPSVWIISPCYNEELVIEMFYRELSAILRQETAFDWTISRQHYRNEVAVEDVDDFGVRERTRPQGKSPASTAAGFHFAVVGKQEDRALLGCGE